MVNRNGQMIMVNLLMIVMTIAIAIALVPMLNAVLGIGKQSDNLNCPGYDSDSSGTVGDHNLDYNSSLASDTISCIAVSMYVPYMILAILIGSVTKLLWSRPDEQAGPY